MTAPPADERPEQPTDADPSDDAGAPPEPRAADRAGDAAADADAAESPVRSPGLPASVTGKSGQRTVLNRSQGGHSVIQQIESRIGQNSRVLLRDEGSEHGASPLVRGQAGRKDAAEADTSVPAGRGNYQVMGEIARGGMGQVLKGHDTDLGRDVAMKVLLQDHVSNDSILQRFVEEAQIGGQLQHPGIVPVYELGLLEDDRPYFTMKLVKGRTLAALFADRRDLLDGRRRFLTIFEQVCQTIAYAHARKVIHRDLKPANIMVGAFGEVQVVDWGLAKVLAEGGVADERRSRPEPAAPAVSIIETVRSGSQPGSGSHSLVGSVMGTPAYMSPEQAQGEIERLDERTDVFALGAILAEILTGRPPYIGEHGKLLSEASRALQDGVRAALDASQAEPELIALAKRCLSASRQARPSNAGALAKEVHDFLASSEERAREAELAAAQARVKAEHERKARRVTLTLAAVVLLAVVGGGYGWLQLRDSQAAQLAATERRQAEVSARVAAILGDVQLLRGQEHWDEAQVALDQAEVVLSASAADLPVGLSEQVAGVRADLDGEARTARETRAAEQRMDTLLTTLDTLQFSNGSGRQDTGVNVELAANLEAAFAAFGLDVLGTDPLQVAAAIRATGHSEPLGMALDTWARSVLISSGFEAPVFRRLIQLAMDVDPDPQRLQLRRAVLLDDREAFERMAAAQDVGGWSPATVITFVQAVRALGHPIDYEPMLRACYTNHPDNPLVAIMLGWTVAFGSRPDESLPFLMVGRALRPTNAGANNQIVRVHLLAGRYDEASAHCLSLVRGGELAEHATNWLMPRVGEVFTAVGEHDRAVELFRRGREIAPDAQVNLNNLSWALSVHPDTSKREPGLAVAAARRALELESGQGQEASANAYNTLGMALFRAGEYVESVDMLRRSMELSDGGMAFDWLVVAMCLERLGLHDDARTWYERGMLGAGRGMPPAIGDNWFMPEGAPALDELQPLVDEARALFGDS